MPITIPRIRHCILIHTYTDTHSFHSRKPTRWRLLLFSSPRKFSSLFPILRVFVLFVFSSSTYLHTHIIRSIPDRPRLSSERVRRTLERLILLYCCYILRLRARDIYIIIVDAHHVPFILHFFTTSFYNFFSFFNTTE